MSHKLRILGVAVVAALSVLAITASAAFGADEEGRLAEGHSNSASGTTFLTGEQGVENVFTVNGGTVKCKNAKFKSSYAGTTAKELTVTPTYTNCTAFGQEATIDFNSCDYHFTQPTETVSAEDPTDLYHAVVHIRCATTGDKIVVTVGDPTLTCKVEVGAQTPTGPLVDLTNNTTASPKKDITITSTVTGITYTTTGGICGKSGENGKYTGTVTLKGYQNAEHTEQVDIWIA